MQPISPDTQRRTLQARVTKADYGQLLETLGGYGKVQTEGPRTFITVDREMGISVIGQPAKHQSEEVYVTASVHVVLRNPKEGANATALVHAFPDKSHGVREGIYTAALDIPCTNETGRLDSIDAKAIVPEASGIRHIIASKMSGAIEALSLLITDAGNAIGMALNTVAHSDIYREALITVRGLVHLELIRQSIAPNPDYSGVFMESELLGRVRERLGVTGPGSEGS